MRGLRAVKAIKDIDMIKDTFGTTGHAHINTAFVTLYNNNYYFIIVKSKFRAGVGVDINKTQSNR